MARQKLPLTDVETGLIEPLKVICDVLLASGIITKKDLTTALRAQQVAYLKDSKPEAAEIVRRLKIHLAKAKREALRALAKPKPQDQAWKE
jgi:hypothetical protein